MYEKTSLENASRELFLWKNSRGHCVSMMMHKMRERVSTAQVVYHMCLEIDFGRGSGRRVAYGTFERLEMVLKKRQIYDR